MTDVIVRVLAEVFVPLAWPAVVLMVVFCFKEEISDALKNIEEAGPKGVVMSPRGQVSTGDTLARETDNPPAKSNQTPDVVTWGNLQPWLSNLEKQLKATDSSGDIDEVKKIAAANDRRASAQFLLRLIYGTQYEALIRMIKEPQSLADLEDLYKIHCEKAGENAYDTPEAWLGWLTQNEIAILTEGKYMPTELGGSAVDLIVSHGVSARESYG